MGELAIVELCAVECELQQSGERSVGWMYTAWDWARAGCEVNPKPSDIIALGRMVEPIKNRNGFRQTGVRVGWSIKPDYSLVPKMVDNLCTPEAFASLDAGEWFREYEEIHPFVDGNGRSGQILYNWLNDTMDAPVWAPNYWDDPRRVPGDGAPVPRSTDARSE